MPVICIGALLIQRDAAVPIDSKLVPSHASPSARGVDRVDCDDRLAIADPAIDQPRHYLVSLSVQSPVAGRLRHAVRELAVAKVMIRSYTDLFRTGDFSVRRILPVDVEFPCQDPVIFKDPLQLGAACSHYYVGRPRGREALAIKVGVVQEIHAVDDDTLLGGRLALE